MIDEAMKTNIRILALAEMKAANKINPLFTDAHHGYAVLKEEIEEVEEELKAVKQMLDAMWISIRTDTTPKLSITMMENHAINLAAEAIQVIAMCNKFRNSSEQWKRKIL